MAEDERRTGTVLDRLVEWARANPIPAGLAGIGVLAVVVLLFAGGDDEIDFEVPQPPASAPAASESTTTTSTEAAIDPNRPDIGPLNCATLLDEDLVDVALFADPTGPRGMFTFAQGETCRYEPDEGEAVVGLEPGDPSDFAEDATLNGVSGEPVADIGRVAVWFDDPDAGIGVLAVGTPVDIGSLFYRIQVGRPDLDGPDRLDLARTLALDALGRFPFVTLPESELEVVTVDGSEPPDLPPLSLDQVLFDGVEGGEWTLGEGLVAVLGALADGTVEAEFGDLPDPSATWVIATAREYLDAQEAENSEEISVLLDRLVPSQEELEAAVPPPAAEASGGITLMGLAQETEEEPCEDCLFEIDVTGPSIEPGKYSVFVDVDSNWWIGDGTAADPDQIVVDAMYLSAAVFEEAGTMPGSVLVLVPGNALFADDSIADQVSGDPARTCQVVIGDDWISLGEEKLPQLVARELSYCLTSETIALVFPDQRWLQTGLALFLSDLVYPDADLEYDNLIPGILEATELPLPMPSRLGGTNWPVFSALRLFSGGSAAGVLDVLRGTGPLLATDPITAFAGAQGVDAALGTLSEELSDGILTDSRASSTQNYDPNALDLPIENPTEVTVDVPRLGTRRLHVTVPPGQYACIDTVINEGDVRMSWRPGAPGETGDWSSDVPDSLEGEATMVLTAVQEGAAYTFDIVEVGDDPDCEPDEDDGPDDPADFACPELCEPSRFFRNALDDFFDLLEG